MKKIILTLSASLLMSTTFATVYHVKTGSTGNGSGNSWANSANIQSAVLWSAIGDTIWMASGTYKANSANAAIIDLMGKELAIYGGFNGTETSLLQADWQANQTILDGDFSGNDNSSMQLNEATRSDNSYNLVVFTGDTMLEANLRLEGLYFKNANNAMAGMAGVGGAIRIYSNYSNQPSQYRSEATIVNCSFEHNIAAAGGAIGVNSTIALGNSTAIVDKCSFVENFGRGSYGGGSISCLSYNIYQAAPASLVVTNSLFSKNASNQSGGAIGSGTSSTGGQVLAIVCGNTFYDNVSTNAPATIDCTNFADSTYVTGFGWVVGSATLIFRNNIVYRPSTTVVPFEIRSKNMAGGNFSSNISDNILDLTNSVYEDITADNQAVDPLFVNAVNNDFHLTACSPAINAGDTNGLFIAGYSYASKDKDGMDRYSEDTLDLGAYEYAMNLNIAATGYVLDAAATTGYTYQWYNCDNGQTISGATSASYTAPLPGNYACIITDNGCATDTTACMPVALSVSSITQLDAEVYPNPVTDRLSISFPAHTVAQITLCSIDGRILHTQQMRGTKTAIPVSELPAGLIILHITGESGSVYTRKIIKQ